MKTQHAKALGVLAALALLIAATTFAGEAQAATVTKVWKDTSTTHVSGGCNAITANGGMPYRWNMGARDMGSYSSAYPDIFTGFPDSYVAFYIWSFDQGRYVAKDTSWTRIPKGLQGVSYPNMTWNWGTGSFALAAALYHNGEPTGIFQVARMTWYSHNGLLLCFNS